MKRIFNFASGPGVMPEAVLQQAKDEFINWNDHGCSILEMSFTGKDFKEVLYQAKARLRSLLNIPSHYQILLMHGGASVQFSLVPLNLLGSQMCADYIETGHWSRRAIAEGQRYCRVNIAASSRENGFSRIPPQDEMQLNAKAAYCHYTSNETANGSQFHFVPESGNVPLVVDMTSDFLTRPIDVARYGMIYASSQKNIGSAGFTVVIVRDDLLDRASHITPHVLHYKAQSEANSLINTPVTFAIYLAEMIFRWIEAQGGLQAMARNALMRSSQLYRAIDESNGFYCCHVLPDSRSHVNVCYTLKNSTLTPLFIQRAAEHGLVNLGGHSALGGVRASLYNAMPEKGVAALIDFMRQFAQAHAK
jgi:phosphoserine aminotransferase